MHSRIFIILLLFLTASCGSRNDYRQSNYSSDSSSEQTGEKYPDDTFCATVEYFNPNTGTRSSYTLTVEVESGEIVQINFPNGGVFDQSHFSGADLDDDGKTTFISDKGYEYEVKIIGNSGDCFNDTPRVARCSGKTKKGRQCKNITDNANGLCWRHQHQE